MEIRMLLLVAMLIIAVPFSNISCEGQQPAQEKAAQKQSAQEKADQEKTVRARPVEDEQESGKGAHSFKDDWNVKFKDQSTESHPFGKDLPSDSKDNPFKGSLPGDSGDNPFEDATFEGSLPGDSGDNPFEDHPSREERDSTE